MNRKHFLALTGLAPLVLLEPLKAEAYQDNDKPVRPTLSKGNAADIKDLEGSVVEKPFDLSTLSAADRKTALQLSSAAQALVLKALLSRKDPSGYPLSKDPDSAERRVAGIVAKMPRAVQARMDRTLADPARRQKVLDQVRSFDLKKELTPATLSLSGLSLRRGAIPEEGLVSRSGGNYNRLDLQLRALHCVDETNPESGTDDMVLGGVLIGASGNTKAINSVVCGEFDDGDITNFGSYLLGFYGLNTTNHYPKTFYAVFQLVESDSDDAELAAQITGALKWITQIVAGVFAGAAVGAVAGGVVDFIGKFIGSFIDDDYFPPYSVMLELRNPNQFGGSNSAKLRTGNIRGHGGIYRIGYRWHLART